MEITKVNNRNGSLLSDTNYVEAPVIRVQIGDYVFGVHKRSSSSFEYPDYIQNMTIETINGTVNKYSLTFVYPIVAGADPNFFEKVFSKVSIDRKISFMYGDALMPENYIYKDNEAIITDVTSSVDIQNARITYTVKAVSASILTLQTSYTFVAWKNKKPSDVIKELIVSSRYKLLDVFKGMGNALMLNEEFIASDDQAIDIPAFPNRSILEYINFLVSYMRPISATNNDPINRTFYTLTTYEDTTGLYGGPYFKVEKIQNSQNVLNALCTYNIDIGYPSGNFITRFDIENKENWAIFYNYNKDLGNSDYRTDIDSNGELREIYSPQLPTTKWRNYENDETWWTRVTEYPTTVSLTIKGLLKPAILMQYVKLNVWFFGHKHISSGYYLIQGQVDKIGIGDYSTDLKLLRIAPDEEYF